MRRKITFGALFLLCTLFTINSFAQTNLVSGYIIENGDTINGFIDYKEWSRNPNEIKFRTQITKEEKTYKPFDISEFGVASEVFISAIVEAEISSENVRSLDDNAILKLRTDTVFLQTFVDGDKSLYFYADQDWKENFYIKQDGKYELLMFKKYSKIKTGENLSSSQRDRVYTVTNDRFKGQLSNYLNDCNSIDKKIKRSKYKKTQLLKVYKEYYKCTASEFNYLKKIEKAKLEYGLFAGLSMTSISFTSNVHPHLTEPNFEKSNDFYGGMYFNLLLPRNLNKWVIANELSYSSFGISGKYEDYRNENEWSITTVELAPKIISYNLLVRYNYPIGKASIFVNAGIGNGMIVSITNKKIVEKKFFADETVTEKEALKDPRSWVQSTLIGAGFSYDRFSLEYRYAAISAFGSYGFLTNSIEGSFITLGYRLSKKK